ncbi:hypothetical protein ES703_79765 [subsurface metagenome]
MIVSKTDNIPTKKIVTVLGKISTNVAEDFPGSEEVAAMQILIRKAKTIGADAIINFSRGIRGILGILGIRTTYTGLAVITEDIIPIQQVLNTSVCWNCGTQIEKSQRFCGFCGTNLI